MKVKVTRTAGLGLHPSLEHALLVIDWVWFEETGEHAILTGWGEEGHSEGSRHYGVRLLHAGKVFSDLRSHAADIRDTLTDPQRTRIDQKLRRRLGELEYDLVWERKKDGARSHLHVEVDRKAG